VIDLHLHTTASDGILPATVLVERAYQVGIHTLSVTDHDTMAGVPPAAEAAAKLGLDFLPGIEITAVLERRDVHVLGYFLNSSPPGLEPFLIAQREDRQERACKIGRLLNDLGVPVNIDTLLEQAKSDGRSVARPLIARELVRAGYVRSEKEAFERWIGDGKPAYVPRQGVSPEEVVSIISRAGGISALAHPGLIGLDSLIPSLAKAGLVAIEVYHSAHDSRRQNHYAKLAKQYGLATCGGSDYHGDSHHRAKFFGKVGLPREEFMRMRERLMLAHSKVQKNTES
jgi:predicted metal-dependent phosphoesterase TrpH